MNLGTRILAWLRQWITPRSADAETALRERAMYALLVPMLAIWAIVALIDIASFVAGEAGLIETLVDTISLIVLCIAYVLARRGRIRAGSVVLVLVYLSVIGFYTYREGYRGDNTLLLIAIVAAGLTLGGRAGFVVATLSSILYGAAAIAEELGWFTPMYAMSPSDHALFFMLFAYLLAGVVAVFGGWTYRGMREQTAALDQQVEALEAADREKTGLLGTLREQLEQQEQLLVDLQASDKARDELSSALRQIASPVVPILDRVVVVPVTGDLTAERIEQLLKDVLGEIERHSALLALLDITGVPAMDAAAADGLLRIVDGVSLLGAECVLVGIRPEVAHAVLDLGIDLSAITSRRDLQSGVEYALARTGRHIVATQ
jgi:anti-anti-sigma regulatory factor